MENKQPEGTSSSAPPPKTKRKKWLYIFAAFGFLAVSIGVIRNAQFDANITAVADSDEALKTTAPTHVRELYEAYENEFRKTDEEYKNNEEMSSWWETKSWGETERKYKNKRLKLKGTVQSISLNNSGFLDLPTGPSVSLELTTFFGPPPTLELEAYFDPSARNAIASLKEGQKIVFTGTLMGMPMKNLILLGNCKLQ